VQAAAWPSPTRSTTPQTPPPPPSLPPTTRPCTRAWMACLWGTAGAPPETSSSR